MSLSSMIKGKSTLDIEFQTIIRNAIPSKSDFKTLSGKAAFSHYEMMAPYLIDSKYSGTVGTAFDYLARAMVAHLLEVEKTSSFLNLKALKGLTEIIKPSCNKRTYEKLNQKYVDTLTDFIDYIYSKHGKLPVIIDSLCDEEWKAYKNYINRNGCQSITNIDKLINGAYYFAKLEEAYRVGISRIDINSIVLDPCSNVICDLSNLCKTFKKSFIDQCVVRANSDVVFSPSFGLPSQACGGADADICIDGVLYDFKTTNKLGYNWKDVAQLTSYYYLNIISKCIKDINRIAFYKARFGEVEYCDVETFYVKAKENIDEISEHLLKRIR